MIIKEAKLLINYLKKITTFPINGITSANPPIIMARLHIIALIPVAVTFLEEPIKK